MYAEPVTTLSQILLSSYLRYLYVKRTNRLRVYPFYTRSIGDVSDNIIENLYDEENITKVD